MVRFASIADGREHWNADTRVPFHRHEAGYAAIVLSGAYEECGSRGRYRVGPGDVLLHGRYDSHLDRFGAKGARILNLVMMDAPDWGLARVADADAIVRTAETDPISACLQLRGQMTAAAHAPADWPDLLAADLLNDPQLSLGVWARARGLAPETVSRGFRKLFDITPAAFRAEARARRAFMRIATCGEPLASVAIATGFADQAHMSRATKALTGETPTHWRRMSNPFKTKGVASV